jgi:hypothetical protein
MAKVAFVNRDENGVFSFHTVDGKVVHVDGGKGHSTDDQAEIAYLDTVPFVKRATSGGGKEA